MSDVLTVLQNNPETFYCLFKTSLLIFKINSSFDLQYMLHSICLYEKNDTVALVLHTTYSKRVPLEYKISQLWKCSKFSDHI